MLQYSHKVYAKQRSRVYHIIACVSITLLTRKQQQWHHIVDLKILKSSILGSYTLCLKKEEGVPALRSDEKHSFYLAIDVGNCAWKPFVHILVFFVHYFSIFCTLWQQPLMPLQVLYIITLNLERVKLVNKVIKMMVTFPQKIPCAKR